MNKFRKNLNIYSIFLALALVFGTIFVFSTPYLWGSDETTHVARVYQLDHGNLTSKYYGDVVGSYTQQGYGGNIPANLLQLIKITDNNLRHPNFVGHQQPIGWVSNPNIYDQVTSQPFSKKTAVYTFTNTAVYAPVVYLPSLIAFKLATIINLSMGWTIHLARWFNLIFYSLCVVAAIWVLRISRAKWLMFCVGLIPECLFQASIVSADGVTNSVAFLFSALFTKTVVLKQNLGKLETILLLACLLIMPIVKPTYIILDAIGLLIPASALYSEKIGKYSKYVTIIAGTAIFAWWTLLTRNVAKTIGLMSPGPWSLSWSQQQVHLLMHNPFSFMPVLLRTLIQHDNDSFTQMIGSFGFNSIQIPAIALVATLLSLVIAFLILEQLPELSYKKMLYIAGVLILSIVGIYATLYVTFTPAGYSVVNGVQGRYFIPFIFLTLIFIASFKRLRLFLEKQSIQYAPTIICALVFTSLLLSAIKFYYITWG